MRELTKQEINELYNNGKPVITMNNLQKANELKENWIFVKADNTVGEHTRKLALEYLRQQAKTNLEGLGCGNCKNAGALCDVIFECPKCKCRINNFGIADEFDNPMRSLSMEHLEDRFYRGTLQSYNEIHKRKCGCFLKEIKRGPECRKILCPDCQKAKEIYEGILK
jgi:hypothetical protein